MARKIATPAERRRALTESLGDVPAEADLGLVERAWRLGAYDWPLFRAMTRARRDKMSVGRLLDLLEPALAAPNVSDELFCAVLTQVQQARLNLNRPTQSAFLDDKIAERFAAPAQPVTGPRRRVIFLLQLALDKTSTLPKYLADLALAFPAGVAIELVVPASTDEVRAHNPKLAERLDVLRYRGVIVHNLTPGSTYATARAVAALCRQRRITALVSNLQLGLGRVATEMVQAPVRVGIDVGHPQWYTSAALDVSITACSHCHWEALSPSVKVQHIFPAFDADRSARWANRAAYRERVGLSESAPVIVSTGMPGKFAHADFWRCVNAVLAQRDVVWIFVGIGRAHAERISEHRGRAAFLGFRDDFAQILSIADVYVDTWPVAGGEALSIAAHLGLPCVVGCPMTAGLFDKARAYAGKAEAFTGSPLMAPEATEEGYKATVFRAIDRPDVREQAVAWQDALLARAPTYETRAQELVDTIDMVLPGG
jgi:hypothetical protein